MLRAGGALFDGLAALVLFVFGVFALGAVLGLLAGFRLGLGVLAARLMGCFAEIQAVIFLGHLG